MKHILTVEVAMDINNQDNMVDVCEAVISALTSFQVERIEGKPLRLSRAGHKLGYVDLPGGAMIGWWTIAPEGMERKGGTVH